MIAWELISRDISSHTQTPFSIIRNRSVSGGSINSAYQLSSGSHCYFIKLNTARSLPMFEAEAAGLKEIADTNLINVPKVICCGLADQHAYLVLEYIDFHAQTTPGTQSDDCSRVITLGYQIAAMHRVTQSQFGWHRDNTIGSTAQQNNYENNWITFWRDNRLGFQLQLASSKGYARQLQTKGDRLLADLPLFFQSYQPQASLLHGDLWSGNYAFDAQGEPVIFDPATYYGDREADVAMTELFGGFPTQFYQSYNESFKLDDGYNSRKTLYNLYHILNHLNLFGSGYLSQCESMMEKLLSEI